MIKPKVLKCKLLFACLIFTKMAFAQADLVVGTNYELNIQRKNTAADVFLLQNAQYFTGLNTLSWETSHATFGLRGIRFNYQSGIHFYANNLTSTAGITFTPTTSFFIGNNGRVGLGVDNVTPEALLHLSGGDVLIDNGNNPSIFTGKGISALNRYLKIANSPGNAIPAGLKVGGVLVATDFNYATPASGDLVVEGKVSIGQNTGSNPNNHSLMVNGSLNATALYADNSLLVSSPWQIDTDKIHYVGNVGIGTNLANNPNNYQLAVNGKIGTHDLQIENNTTTWPDYVFDKHYVKPSLDEVERYIESNHRLEGMPSADDVKANGYSVHDLNVQLLKKVEELTLYLIEQQKELNQLKEQLKAGK